MKIKVSYSADSSKQFGFIVESITQVEFIDRQVRCRLPVRFARSEIMIFYKG